MCETMGDLTESADIEDIRPSFATRATQPRVQELCETACEP
jgi:hypothetical protein